MSASSPKKSFRNVETTEANQEVEVLYQQLGDKWYAFSVMGDDIFMTPIDFSEVEAARAGNSLPNKTAA